MHLNKLIEIAGEAKEQPAPPDGGIPKQWLPGFIRWPVRALFLPFVLLDHLAHFVARLIIKPPFKKVGKCKRRGNCCHYILFRKHRGFIDKVFLFWCRQFNGFFLREKNPQALDGRQWWVMGCRYLKKDGACKHYFFRPAICRNWPVIEYFGRPQILKGCGYKAEVRKGKKGHLNIID